MPARLRSLRKLLVGYARCDLSHVWAVGSQTDAILSALHPLDKRANADWRMEQLVSEGGFAMITGDVGTGKSCALRLLHHRIAAMRDVNVGVLAHPQSRVTDFYRELGDVFGVTLSASNRRGSFKSLREKWQSHIETSAAPGAAHRRGTGGPARGAQRTAHP